MTALAETALPAAADVEWKAVRGRGSPSPCSVAGPAAKIVAFGVLGAGKTHEVTTFMRIPARRKNSDKIGAMGVFEIQGVEYRSVSAGSMRYGSPPHSPSRKDE